MIKVACVWVLAMALLSDALEMMMVNRNPWWSHEMDGNGIENNYRYYYPYYNARPNFNPKPNYNTKPNYNPNYNTHYNSKPNYNYKANYNPNYKPNNNPNYKPINNPNYKPNLSPNYTPNYQHNPMNNYINNRNLRKHQRNRPKTDFKVKMPRPPKVPKTSDYESREWPDYIPPIRMIKLPMDEPPAART